MATINVNLPNLTVGTTSFGPINIPSGVTHIKVALDRTTAGGLNAGDSGGQEVVTITTQFSHDTGATWQSGPSFGASMGTFINPTTGLPYTESSMAFSVTTPCIIRGVVTITQSFSTTLTITTS